MNIDQPGIYHIYNRGINQQRIFYNRGNYLYFLRKCHKYIKPIAEIFAWCLAPTHFNFLLEVTEKSMQPVKQGSIFMPTISNGFRILQSSFAKGINIQMKRTGNLFQQKAKSKLIKGEEQAITTFHYIHQIPIVDGLVRSVGNWPYTSYPDYIDARKWNLCNKERAFELLLLNEQNIKPCLEVQLTNEMMVDRF